MSREPNITINGHQLTEAQAMTVRVALETFALDLADGLGNDETGKAIAAGYIARIQEVRKLMFEPGESAKEGQP